MADIKTDPRIDPRIRNIMGSMPVNFEGDVESREQLMAEITQPESIAAWERTASAMAGLDNEQVAPSSGLAISTHEFTSAPDGNTIKVQFIRPESSEPLPCVYYIHGGGMGIMSCFDGIYRAWGRIIAQRGVAVAMVDFRNCMLPSSSPEVAPFPAGLNDCVSGVKWLSSNARELGIDPGAHHRGRRERRRQPDPGYRSQTQGRRRPDANKGAVCPVSLYRGTLAPGSLPLVD